MRFYRYWFCVLFNGYTYNQYIFNWTVEPSSVEIDVRIDHIYIYIYLYMYVCIYVVSVAQSATGTM